VSALHERIHKFPRTPHIEGSRVQPGDEDLESVPFEEIAGRHLVVEEKVDGANAGISFSAGEGLLLQSRGHYLSGGGRERHFNLFKRWASAHQEVLGAALGDRYVLYGEWVYAKHTVFYDALPHYFLEFDVLDLRDGCFLDTPRRRELLTGTPVASVPVLREGVLGDLEELKSLLGPSGFVSVRHSEVLEEVARQHRQSVERVRRETDPSRVMEGLYIKVEENGSVAARYKFVRRSFLTAVLEGESHWQSRPILPNRLAAGVDLFPAEEA